MMKSEQEMEVEVFLLRWLVFVFMAGSILFEVNFVLGLDVSGLMGAVIFIPPIIFFGKEVFRIFCYWYLLIRGRPPGNFWDFVGS